MGTTEPSSAAGPPPPRRGLLAPPSCGGAGVALLGWWASLQPSLLPRPVVLQGLVTVASLAVFYGLGGVVVRASWLAWNAASWPRCSAEARRIARGALLLSWVISVVVGLALWQHWQNVQRTELTMPRQSPLGIVTLLVVTTVFGVGVVVLGRLVARGLTWCSQRLQRRCSVAVARSIVGVALVVVLVGVGNSVVLDGLLNWADISFGGGDAGTEVGVVQPTSPEVSGGPGSLVAWSSLGLQGRSWVASASALGALQRFAGAGAHVEAPIRAYAGLKSASTDAARAKLALDDLIRAGGFSRKIVVVATATGSGWVNPVMSSALEYLWGGDCAEVSMQYSYLPSWIAYLTDTDKAAAAGAALNRAVYDYWATLPAAHRPLLVMFGESLGSYGAEFAYRHDTASASFTALAQHFHAVLLVGPTNANPSFNALLDARKHGSPPWQPVLDGAPVLVANSAAELGAVPNRGGVLYLLHATDPVTWWSWRSIWSEPTWLASRPRGAAVAAPMTWVPFVTWLQNTVDLIQGFSAPAGFGHNYNDAWAQALVAAAAPRGWTSSDTTRLATAMVELHGLGGNT